MSRVAYVQALNESGRRLDFAVEAVGMGKEGRLHEHVMPARRRRDVAPRIESQQIVRARSVCRRPGGSTPLPGR